MENKKLSKKEIIQTLNQYLKFKKGWDGEADSLPPNPKIIEQAISLINEWPQDLNIPLEDIDCDGNIIFEYYDENGYIIYSIDLLSDKNIAVFIRMDGTKILQSTKLKIETKKDRTLLFKIIKKSLEK